MIDIGILRNNLEDLKQALKNRHYDLNLDEVIKLDKDRRKLVTELEEYNQLKNKANDEISKLLKEKKDAKKKIAEMKAVSDKITKLKPKVDVLTKSLEEKCLLIPNIPAGDCPVGPDTKANKVIRVVGDKKKFSFKPKSHVVLGEELGLIDFKRSAKLSGSAFVLFQNQGAKLERALIQWMLDVHTQEHGYTEISPPFLVKRKCMEGTGQLPKFEEDMYRTFRGSSKLEDGKPTENDMFLVPTAEVPLTNIHREETLTDRDLPINYVAYTPCFRLEAGAYGKDTKGMIRVHQFDKVELVKICEPENSAAEHEKLLENAEKIFKMLNIPYRVVLLSTGDLGFAASRCYDIEVWAPGLEQWLEASSCSNFMDFQARRAGIRFKSSKTKKKGFCHTLNGSGVALSRTFIALVENHQQADGSILIPDVLRPYMGNKTHIKKSS